MYFRNVPSTWINRREDSDLKLGMITALRKGKLLIKKNKNKLYFLLVSYPANAEILE